MRFFLRVATSALLIGIVFIPQQSCLKANAIQCADGTWCVVGMVCSEHFGSNVCVPEYGCGNHKKDTGEVCDDGNLNNGDGCSESCQSETCGNGIVEDTEQCDDRNRTDGDTCRGDCGSDYTCNNGVVDKETGEECDPMDKDTGPECAANCKLIVPSICGDNMTEGVEECDPGTGPTEGDPSRAQMDSSNCDSDCTLPMCGDGHFNPMKQYDEDDPNAPAGDHEECDGDDMGTGGNMPNCDADCTIPYCGDGFTNPMFQPNGLSVEECDPGTGNNDREGNATADSQNCDRDCTFVMCGDEVRNEVVEDCETKFSGCSGMQMCEMCHCVDPPPPPPPPAAATTSTLGASISAILRHSF